MNYWNGSVKIGNLLFPRFMGGPLDGITDSPFRKIVRQFSQKELLYTEMRHVACVANDKGQAKTLEFSQLERPLNYQVAANKVDFIQKACELIQQAGVDVLDLNIGCPARAVVNSGSGSFLMSDPCNLELILKTFRQSLTIPFTVKIRAGYKTKNAVDIARLIQDCGADGIAIHPRLQTQQFFGVPDYDLAAQVKRAVNIPVLLSGGVVNWSIASQLYEQTGVDGFLIARGMWAKPWKLHELYENSQGRIYKPTDACILQAALDQLDSMLVYYGPRGLFAFRKHLPFYIKGKPTASSLRQKLVVTDQPEEVREGLRQFFGA